MSTHSCSYVITQSCSNAVDKIMRIQVSKSSINVKTKICGGGHDGHDFDMVIGARWANLSISETADPLGRSHTVVYNRMVHKKNIW